MPSVVIAALFTATIVGATSIFVRLGDYSIENLFMYFYLITYRVKIVLDDLHYYASMEDTAIRRGDPAFAFFSWVLWLAAAAVIGNPPAYYTFIGITFAVMIGWILIARKNVKERSDEQDRKETESAHSRWLVLNFVPAAVGLGFGLLAFTGLLPKWKEPVLVYGSVLMVLALIYDIVSDYEYMFPKSPDRKPEPPMNKTEWRNDAETSVEKDVSVKDIQWLVTDVHEQHIKSLDLMKYNKGKDPNLPHDATELQLHAFKRLASLMAIVIKQNQRANYMLLFLNIVLVVLTLILTFKSFHSCP